MRGTAHLVSRHRSLLAILAVALAARLVVLVGYLGTHQWKPEVWEYEQVAQNLLAGRGYMFVEAGLERRTFGWPVLPLVSYLLHLIGGKDNFVPYLVFQLAASVGIVGLTYWLASRWLNPATGLVAALLVALEPGLIVYGSYKVHETTLATFLLLVWQGLFVRVRDENRLRWAAVMGLVTGLGILTRGTFVAVFAPLGAWMLARARVERQTVISGLAVIVLALLTIAPWTVRNYLVLGRFVLVSSGWSNAFWRGNNPYSSGANLTVEGKTYFELASPEFRQRVFASREMERYDLYRESALRYIHERPVAFAGRSLKKLRDFFWFPPTYGFMYGVSPGLLVGYQVGYAVMLVFALLGTVVALSRGGTTRSTGAYLVILVFALAGLHAVVYVEGRHKLMVMPILLMFSAYGIRHTGVLRSRLERGRSKPRTSSDALPTVDGG